MARLIGKTCVVTGAAHGIGRAIAEAFQAEGAIVVATDKDEIAGKSMSTEAGCQFLHLDVRREDDWEELALRVPTVDVVVNNAGVTGFEDGPTAHDPETASLDALARSPQCQSGWDVPRLSLRDPRYESPRDRIYHQHVLALRARRHPAR